MTQALAPTWDGVGTSLPSGVSLREGFIQAGLGWRVEDQALQRIVPAFADGKPFDQHRSVDTHKALVRSDSGEFFNVVSDGFRVLQNMELADVGEALIQDGLIDRIEAAGSLKGGRRVFMRASVGDFLLGTFDRVQKYLYFSNAHDGSGSVRVFGSSTRHACQNVLSAVAHSSDIVRIPHRSGLKAALEGLKPRVLAALKSIEAIEDQSKALAARKMDAEATRDYFRQVFTALWPDKVERASLHGDQNAKAEIKAVLDGWIENLHSPRNIDVGTSGTAWAALNAVTEWAEHGRTVRVGKGEDAAEQRTFSRLFGVGQDIKAAAFSKALAVLA